MINLENKRIVVTFLMHLGDLILITPFLQVLRNNAPGSHITLVVDKKLEDVVRYNPNVDSIVTVDKKGADDSPGSLWHIGRRLHQNHPDLLINLHPNERTSFLATVIHADQFVGMSHFLARPFMDIYTRLDRKTLHAADMYINVLEQLGVTDTRNAGLQIFTCPQWQETAHDFYQAAGLQPQQKLIGFNIGSAVPQKRWPASRFAAVADYFSKLGYGTAFYGGTMDQDMVDEAVSYMNTKPIIATGQFSIGELAAAIQRCSVFITNDSGPMHVAVSQKVPVVALYGPSNPKFYGPYTDKAIVLESMKEYEVGKSMKQIIKEGRYEGVSVISTDQVIHAVTHLLQS
jgi:heptosyltransferase-2